MGINYNPFSLEGKTILVTGASSGIGRATAIECSKLGANVIVTARSKERLQETYEMLEGSENRQVIADLTNNDDLGSLVTSVGKIDGVVLCAGKGRRLPVLFSTREEFDDIYNVNFFSQVELLRMLAKKKCLNSNSSVVIVTSVGGNHKFSPGHAIYGSSKAALGSMVRFCSIEFAPKKIRVNGVCPGMVETPLIKRGTLTDEQFEADKAMYPLKRYGQPEEIAHGIIYLLSDASSWVTGINLVIDGGVSVR